MRYLHYPFMANINGRSACIGIGDYGINTDDGEQKKAYKKGKLFAKGKKSGAGTLWVRIIVTNDIHRIEE
jgi:hypothetical protein